jgi:hypothetical protein
MKEVIIFKRDDYLSPTQAFYYKDLLYRTLKVGTELEMAPPKGVKRKVFEDKVREKLAPTGSVEQLGKWGVFDVQKEHCGVEVRVIGRHPFFHVLYDQFSYILGVIQSEGGRARSTCGMHFHTLPVGLSEPIPEIVLANIWNLVRRYAPNLKYIFSCGDKMDALCRRRNHNSHLEMVKHTPAVMSMREIKETLDNSKQVPKHQNFLNLEHVKFNDDDDVSDFHLEFRFPDSDFSPLSVVSKIFLIWAMVLKSVEMSQHGVIHVGKYQEWKRKKEILDILNNNEGNLATSDTSQLTPEILDELRDGCNELLNLLKPIFKRFEHNPTFKVLSSLANEPISLRRIKQMEWQEIERQLQADISAQQPIWDKIDRGIMKIIEVQEFSDFQSDDQWRQAVSNYLFLKTEEIEKRLMKISSFREIEWDSELGTYIF